MPAFMGLLPPAFGGFDSSSRVPVGRSTRYCRTVFGRAARAVRRRRPGSNAEHAMEFLQALDLGTLFWFGSVHQPWLDTVMATVTHLGRARVLIVVVLLVALGFVISRQYRAAVLIVLLGIGSTLLSEAVKRYVLR